MRINIVLYALAGLILSAISGPPAHAQLSTPTCPGTPNALGTASAPITALPYTVTFNDVCLLKIFNSATPGVVNIPAPGTGGNFGKNFPMSVWNEGAGAVTLTPQFSSSGFTPTINGAATIALAQGQGASLAIGTDGNWYANTGTGSSGGSTASFFNATGPNGYQIAGSTVIDGSKNATLAAITATTFNGNTISTGTGTISLGSFGAINISSVATDGLSMGYQIGSLGSESVVFGGQTCSGGCNGGVTAFGHGGFFVNNGAAPNSSIFGDGVFELYTGSGAVSGFGATVLKHVQNCNNCAAFGDGAGQNWTSNSGTTNTLSIFGGNSTFAGTSGNGTLQRIEVFGCNIAANSTVGQQDNIFMGCNMLNGTYRAGSHDVFISTYGYDTPAAGTSNSINIEGVWSATGTGTASTSVSTIAGSLVVSGAASVQVAALTASLPVCTDASKNLTSTCPAGDLPILIGTTGSIGGGALLAGACTSGTVAVTNSTTAMSVQATPVTYPGDGNYWLGYVSTNGTVTVKVCGAVAGTPSASAYNVRVIQ